MKGAGTIQTMITSLRLNRIRRRRNKPFSRIIKRKGGTILWLKKTNRVMLKTIKSKIRTRNRIMDLMFTRS